MKTRLAIVGAGGHAKVVLDAAVTSGDFEIWGLVSDDDASQGTAINGVEVRGKIEELAHLRDEFDVVVVAIGDNLVRARITRCLTEAGLTPASVVHSAAVVAATAGVGRGCMIMAGAVVQPSAVLGIGSIVNTAASVDHDCQMGDFVHIAPGARLAGSVSVEEGAMIGLNAVVVPGISIGAWSVIGAGSVVVNDIPPRSVAYGVPARVRRSNA